ncbi:MAG: Holliday junction resolvase RuvX [Bacteroidales bacterium]|nr:Holliday junction resolvase RuvX [Bacteroidales bacterium]
MNRIIGIDFGRKRTGLAVSDPLGVFASPLETVPGTKVLEFLKEYSISETITDFVVGWPRNLDGTLSEAAADVKAFLGRLEKAFPDVPVHLEDERFTSVLAHRAMIDGGMKASDRKDKASVDRISAAIILQGFLDRTAGTPSGTGFAPETLSVPPVRTRRNSGKKK